MGVIKPPIDADGTIAWDKLEIIVLGESAERPASTEECRRIIQTIQEMNERPNDSGEWHVIPISNGPKGPRCLAWPRRRP